MNHEVTVILGIQNWFNILNQLILFSVITERIHIFFRIISEKYS